MEKHTPDQSKQNDDLDKRVDDRTTELRQQAAKTDERVDERTTALERRAAELEAVNTALAHEANERQQAQDRLRRQAVQLKNELAERKRMEEEIRCLNADLERRVRERTARLSEQTKTLESVVNNINEGLAVANADGKFTYFNSTAERILGFGLAEANSLEWSRSHEVLRPDTLTPLPKDQLPLVQALRGKRVSNVEIVLRNPHHPDGVFLCCSAAPLVADDGIRFGGVIVFRDVTEQLRAEKEIRRMNMELAAANTELEAFSYSVSHDLRAPLRAIDGFSRILLEDFAAELSPDASELLSDVRKNAQQMGQLVDDLLAFARITRQSLKMTSVNFAEIVRNCWDVLFPEREGRDVEATIGNFPVCRADPTLMKQVWMNLIGNALKYTRRCATAKIEIGCQPGSENGAHVYFVKDNGVGFDMRYAHKLFGVFQRLHRAEDYEGTGVGLALVQRIVHRHGGRIWADSAPGNGATFYYTLEGSFTNE